MRLRFRTLHISRWTAVAVGLLAITTAAHPQSSPSPDTSMKRAAPGATLGVTVPMISSTQSNTFAPVHRSPSGAACLRVAGQALPFANNNSLFNHWIYVENTCSDRIRLKVCYYSTTNCIDMDVPGRDRKQAILGTLPSVKDFRYDYRERF